MEDLIYVFLFIVFLVVPILGRLFKALQEWAVKKDAEKRLEARAADRTPTAKRLQRERELSPPGQPPYAESPIFLEPAQAPPPPARKHPPAAGRAVPTAPLVAPETETPAYKSLTEYLSSRSVEHVSEWVRHDIEEQVEHDLGRGEGSAERRKKGARKRTGALLPESLSRDDLRRALVLAELLHPPLALREPGEGPLAPHEG